MADLVGTIGANFVTVIPTAVALARGIRVTLNSSGLVAASASTERGDYVVDEAAAASEPCAAVPMQLGCLVPAVASEDVAVGDPAYSAASGKFSKTSTNAVLCGKWTQAASTGVLGQVLLGNPA